MGSQGCTTTGTHQREKQFVQHAVISNTPIAAEWFRGDRSKKGHDVM